MNVAETGKDIVVQTIWKGAAKTFAQAFLAVLIFALIPVLTKLGNDLITGEAVGWDDLNVIGRIVAAGVVGGVAALISYAWNFLKTPTLPQDSNAAIAAKASVQDVAKGR